MYQKYPFYEILLWRRAAGNAVSSGSRTLLQLFALHVMQNKR